MAHPYAAHRQTKVEHDRVAHLTKGYATGGAVEGRATGGRAPKHHGKGTNVNVIVAPGGGHPAAPMAGVGPSPPMGAAPPMPMARPPMPAGPPMAGPGPMVPPGGPIRSSGGRTGYKSGGAVPGPAWAEGRKNGTQVSHRPGKNDLKDMDRPPVITKATGGPVEHPMKGGMAPKLGGGAGGGEARLEKPTKAIIHGR